MSSTNYQKALKLQKKIYTALKQEVDLLLGKPHSAITKYQNEIKIDFRNSKGLREVTRSELTEAILAADVTFIGDFHTFNQAQKTALKIIQEVAQANSIPLWIGVEFIPSNFQKHLDAVQAKQMSIHSLHEAMNYKESWGFPWQHYEPILIWAIENQVRLIALNRPQRIATTPAMQDLHERDYWAAGVITDLFYDELQKGIRPKVIVLYGDFHVGSCHLPEKLQKISQAFLKQSLTWVAVHQNYDQLYWKLAKKQKHFNSEVFKLKSNIFCVFSSTPWAKLQSMISWIEGLMESEVHSHSDYEIETDIHSHICEFAANIAKFLGINPSRIEPVCVYTINQVESLERMIQDSKFSYQEKQFIRFHIKNNQRFYAINKGIAYIGIASFNRAAELAAIHLFQSSILFNSSLYQGSELFYYQILESAFGFFGSVILNPRRKCDLPQDHRSRILLLNRGEKPYFPHELEARILTLNLLENQSIALKSFKKISISVLVMAPKYLGYILGKKLYEDVIHEKLKISEVQKLFFNNQIFESSDLKTRYIKLRELVSPIPAKLSKNEYF